MTARSFTLYRGYFLIPHGHDVGEGRFIGYCEICAEYPRPNAPPRALERVATPDHHPSAEAAARAAEAEARRVVDGLAGPPPDVDSDRKPWDSR